MKRIKYLLVLVVATLVYVTLSLTVGQNSINCYKHMEEQKKLIAKQASEIEAINDNLKLECYALQNDKALIAAYAHKLDYVAENEKLVKINGLSPVQKTLYDTGNVIRHTDPEFLSERICKIISTGSGALVLIILLMFDISAGNFAIHKKEPVVKGIPIYDLPQV